MADPAGIAVRRFDEGFNCAQAVFSAIAETSGLPLDMALRIATPFGGGIARAGQTCGAVTGALMALGLTFGTASAADKEGKERQYRIAQDLMERFKERHGSTVCRDLLGYDISTPEGLKEAHDKGLFTTLCPLLVADAVGLVAGLRESGGRAAGGSKPEGSG
jgi:C_GCAxxG_C_C family probable redox protein